MADECSLSTYAHDFESTIQDYVTDERQLVGILNFSALWHEVVYLNDIALGDNPHLIRSFLDPGRHSLYLAVTEFIRGGILRCHLRDKIAIKGSSPVKSDGSLAQVYDQWWKDGPPDRFITQIFHDDRHRFNQAIDSYLKQFPKSVVPYDPDVVKPRFRNTIRGLLQDTDSGLRQLLRKLPPEIERKYRSICDTNEYFTNADLWRLYKGISGSEELVVAHGHINQLSSADLVHAGTTGTRISTLALDRFDWKIHVGTDFGSQINPPKTIDEVMECAEFVLKAPSLELLGLLTPQQVMKLREKAEKTIFRTANEAPKYLGIQKIPTDLNVLPSFVQQLPIETFRRKYESAMKDYWLHICAFLEQEFPDRAIAKGRLIAIAYDKLSEIPSPLRIGFVGISMMTAMSMLFPETGALLWKLVAAAGLAPTLNHYLGKLAYHILLERTPAMAELKGVNLSLGWRPKGVFAMNRWE